ncbi:MAG TPA: BON domain-containing protein [Phenylobacterium sp.]|nr:BON domain-containing protein [Phenylobacterium sp.]
MNDKSLRDAVLAELDRLVDGAPVAVAVLDGVVTLTGRIGAPIDRLRIDSAASRVAGVRAVVDKLEFDDVQDRDVAIARAAADLLDGFEKVSRGSLRLVVRDAVVTLSGEVPDHQLRTVLEQELLGLAEVSDIQSQLHVALPGGDVGERLGKMLAWEGATIRGLKVAETDGVVSLAGEAEGWFDRDALERLAWALPGVREVINRVTLPAGAVDPTGDSGTTGS